MNTILRKQFLAHVGQTSPEPMMIEVARAEGVFFYTPEGKRYYDLVAGVSVSNVGHANPRVVEAVQRQAADYMHIMVYGEMIERPQVRYAARIAELLPGELSSVYFVNSGAEAIEGALKLAKRYTHRTELVSMRRAYHGSTQGAMSLMGEPEGEEWKGAFRPLLPDVRAIDFNDFDQLRLITRRTACVVVEPVQGEAGVRPPVPGWLEALRRRCDEVGALLVFDEIQTGMGRTGEMFAMCKYGVTPDIVCLAKAFGGGMPLGAFVSRKEIMDTLQTAPTLGHITTFGGHPVCCATGLAALEYLLETGTVEHVEGRGVLYESLLADHPQVVEIRRSGLLLAVELGSSAKMFRMMELFKEAGILSDWFLYCDTAFRISPPLTITEEEVRDSARLIRECLAVHTVGVGHGELIFQVVGNAVGGLGQDVGGGRRDDQQVAVARERQMLHRSVEGLCLHGMSRERSKRERSDKFGCRLRHADAHCSTRLDQKPYELTGLVGGDAARDSHCDVFGSQARVKLCGHDEAVLS